MWLFKEIRLGEDEADLQAFRETASVEGKRATTSSKKRSKWTLASSMWLLLITSLFISYGPTTFWALTNQRLRGEPMSPPSSYTSQSPAFNEYMKKWDADTELFDQRGVMAGGLAGLLC